VAATAVAYHLLERGRTDASAPFTPPSSYPHPMMTAPTHTKIHHQSLQPLYQQILHSNNKYTNDHLTSTSAPAKQIPFFDSFYNYAARGRHCSNDVEMYSRTREGAVPPFRSGSDLSFGAMKKNHLVTFSKPYDQPRRKQEPQQVKVQPSRTLMEKHNSASPNAKSGAGGGGKCGKDEGVSLREDIEQEYMNRFQTNGKHVPIRLDFDGILVEITGHQLIYSNSEDFKNIASHYPPHVQGHLKEMRRKMKNRVSAVCLIYESSFSLNIILCCS